MRRSIKKIAFLDRFYKNWCCGARNHPHGWRTDKRITNKTTRLRLKKEIKEGEEE